LIGALEVDGRGRIGAQASYYMVDEPVHGSACKSHCHNRGLRNQKISILGTLLGSPGAPRAV